MNRLTPTTPLKTLGQLFDERPNVTPAPIDYGGWLFPGTKAMLSDNLDHHTRCVVEIGSWRGKSTRHILQHAPYATIYCIDTWLGSKEHMRMFGIHYDYIMANLYEQFVHDCWEYRNRIIPVREKSHEGLATVADMDVHPNLIYIDGSHEYEDVYGDIILAHEHFPRAVICGDDYDKPWPGVKKAVNQASDELKRTIIVSHPGWRLYKESKR